MSKENFAKKYRTRNSKYKLLNTKQKTTNAKYKIQQGPIWLSLKTAGKVLMPESYEVTISLLTFV